VNKNITNDTYCFIKCIVVKYKFSIPIVDLNRIIGKCYSEQTCQNCDKIQLWIMALTISSSY